MKHLDLFFLVAAYLVPLALFIQILVDKRKSLSRNIMAFTLFITFVVNFFNYLYLVEDYTWYLPVHGLHAGLEFFVFPSIFLYIKSVVSPRFQLTREWAHFLPGIVMLGVATYIFYIYTGGKDLLYFMTHNRMGADFDHFKFTVLKVSRYIHLSLLGIQGVLYAIAFIKIPEEYNLKLQNEFSNIENFSIDWINKYLLSFALIVIGGFLSYALIPLKGIHHHIIVFVFFVFSMYISRLGILAVKQQVVDVDLDEFIPESVAQSELVQINDTQLKRKLTSLMKKKQLFLNPELSLSALAAELGTNRTYLSALINQQFGVNFSTYINQLRAEYAKNYMQQYPDTKKEELCQKSGFGSVSTMHRVMGK